MRLCWCCRCRCSTRECDEESEPLNLDPEAEPPAVKRQSSLWERARRRLSRMVSFERAAGFTREAPDEPLPRCLLDYEQRCLLLPLLPPTLRHKRWKLLFTTEDHGCSIKSLLNRAHGCGPTVVLVRDKQRHTFGAFAAAAWRRYPEPHFYGTGEGFLFSTWPEEAEGFRAWRWSGANRYFQAAAIDFVAFGSGGHFGLWLGSSLTTGSTGRCATYENEPLTQHSVHGGLEAPYMGDSAFEVAEVQVWGFV